MKIPSRHRSTAAASIRAAALVLATALGLASCDNSYGIFASIQQETKVTGSTIFKLGVVGSVVGTSTDYYAKMSTIYSRSVGDSSWHRLSVGSLGTDYFPTAMAALPNDDFFVAAVRGSSFQGVKKRSSAGASWSDIDCSTIVTTLSSGAASYNVDGLFSANSTLFAQGHKVDGDDVSSYYLFYLVGTSFALVNGLSASAAPYVGVAYANGQYWYANQSMTAGASRLFADADPSDTAVTDATDSGYKAGTSYISAICPDESATSLYVVTYDGYIHRISAGTTWVTGSRIRSDSDYLLTSAVVVTQPSAVIVVSAGTLSTTSGSGPGYYEASAFNSGFDTGSDGAFSDESNYSTTISGKPVNSLYWDAARGVLFACTSTGGFSSGSGLYSNRFANGAWSGWDSE